MAQAFENAANRHRSGYSDLILAGGVLLIMGLMVLRLPTPLIDALVAVNITVGVCLLLVAIYIPSPVMFNSFPSVLLISTLFRLALTVATTRLILLEADAGDIIQAFGSFVAGGNLVVGIVVFIIITVVQFIVIAKGAERVAEVSARFTLDAMPGKQLSIDSDLRSGLIEKEEAKRRRNLLESESQLNGALDGAMKFVKGDAIASIIIVVVNLAGGLTVGIAQHNLGFAEALETYSILTIGDGMVAQIPALLGAMAAGLVVTRTTSEGDRHLGMTIGRQIVAQPRALLLTAVMAILLALTPGFPSLIFIGIAVALLASSGIVSTLQSRRAGGGNDRTARYNDRPPADVAADAAIAISRPLIVEFPERLAAALSVDDATGIVERARQNVMETYGVPLPRPEFRVMSTIETLQIRIFDVAAAVPPASDAPAAEERDVLAHQVSTVLITHARDFIGIQEVTQLQELATREYPALVREVGRHVNNQQIAEVLRNLVDERVPIRNLRSILESLAEHGEREKNPAELTELVRIGLRQLINRLCLREESKLQAAALTPESEAVVRAGLKATPAGIVLSLAPAELTKLRDAIAEALRRWDTGRPPVVLTSPDIRRHVRHIAAASFPALRVVSYAELLPGTGIDVRAQVAI